MGFLRSFIYGRGWRVNDARGREVALYNHITSRENSTVPPEVFSRIRATANARAASGWETGSRVLGWLFVVAITFGTISELINNPVKMTPGRAVGVLFWPAIVTFVLVFGRKLIRGSPENFARAMREHGHCPGCGYPLAPSVDATTTCSECGAVWRNRKAVKPQTGSAPARS